MMEDYDNKSTNCRCYIVNSEEAPSRSEYEYIVTVLTFFLHLAGIFGNLYCFVTYRLKRSSPYSILALAVTASNIFIIHGEFFLKEIFNISKDQYVANFMCKLMVYVQNIAVYISSFSAMFYIFIRNFYPKKGLMLMMTASFVLSYPQILLFDAHRNPFTNVFTCAAFMPDVSETYFRNLASVILLFCIPEVAMLIFISCRLYPSDGMETHAEIYQRSFTRFYNYLMKQAFQDIRLKYIAILFPLIFFAFYPTVSILIIRNQIAPGGTEFIQISFKAFTLLTITMNPLLLKIFEKDAHPSEIIERKDGNLMVIYTVKTGAIEIKTTSSKRGDILKSEEELTGVLLSKTPVDINDGTHNTTFV